MNHTILRLLAGLTLVALRPASAGAIDLHDVLTDHTITSWTQEDGLPPGTVWAIAQDAKGYLWVGTDDGLRRFDGIRFVRWDAIGSATLPTASVRAMCVSHDGSLWVGFDGHGGVSHLQDAQAWNYGEASGLPQVTVRALVEDADGIMWAATEAGLFRFSDRRWVRWTAGHGLPDSPVYGAALDRRARLVVGTAAGVFRRGEGSADFERVEVGDDAGDHQPRSITEGPLDQLYVSDLVTGFRRLADRDLSGSRDYARGYRLLYDRRGNLWVGTLGQGLWRARLTLDAQTLEIQKATTLTGLLSDEVMSLAEDAEGKIWIGTRQGLNRLTPRKFRQFANLGLPVGLDTTPDGSVWIGTIEELIRFSPERPEVPAARIPLAGSKLRAIYADDRETLWLATERGLLRLTDRSPEPMLVPATARLHQIDLLTSDTQGGVWLHDATSGLLSWNGHQLAMVPLPPGLRPSQVSMLHTDSRGRIWVGFSDGQLGLVNQGEDLQLLRAEGAANPGAYRQIHEDRSGIVWLAAAEGLSRFTNGRLDTLARSTGFPMNNLTALIDDDAENLWIGTRSGIVRLAKDEYARAVRGDVHDVHYTTYSRTDGLPDSPISYNSSRHVIRARDNVLWFLTSGGVTLIDPRSFNQASMPTPVRIEYANADDSRLLVTHQAMLPSRTSRLDIVYAATNSVSPLRTRFRYRLEGFDADWVVAGTRRQASYSNLPPRRYRFTVVSGNDDGTWAPEGAVWDFSITPRFYQTLWFYGVVAAAIGLSTWGVWQARMREVRRRFSLLLSERARLSRDLHDTLLQSLVGTALQLDIIAGDVEPLSPAVHRRFVRVRKRVEEYVREARQSIWELRSPTLDRRDLAKALPEVCRHVVAGYGVAFEFAVNGAVRRCQLTVEEQLLRIGREAVANAVRHGRPQQVTMTLRYDDSSVTLTITDDGCGFDLAEAAEGAADHYGLVGMKERAREAGGTLQIVTGPNAGTEITARVPIGVES